MRDKEICKVNMIFNEKDLKSSKFGSLIVLEDSLVYKHMIISVDDIKGIDLSMCSSQAGINL